MRLVLVLILVIPSFSYGGKYTCAKHRQAVAESYTYKTKEDASCKNLCAIALEKAGSVCAKHGVDIKLEVINDGLDNCNKVGIKNTSCTVNIQCDVCVR